MVQGFSLFVWDKKKERERKKKLKNKRRTKM